MKLCQYKILENNIMETKNLKEIEENLKDSVVRKEELTKEKLQLASLINFGEIKEVLEQTDNFGFLIDSKE